MSSRPFDAEVLRGEFPGLAQQVMDRDLVYLDSAASAQQPQSVIDAVGGYMARDHANVHRGVHTLSRRATEAYEGARATAANFLGAADPSEVVFTRGTTEAINLVAQTWALENLEPEDAILLTELEHHSNLVPWQMVAQRTGAELRVVPIDDRGALDQGVYEDLLDPLVKLVAVGHVSNALGTVNPIAEMIQEAHRVGAKVLVDGAQGAVHGTVDVSTLGCDFYTLSGHKLYGPTGIGVLWARAELLEDMPPWHGGGEMIREVSFDGTTYADPPARFEAGTPNISGAVGLAAAMDWMEGWGRDAMAKHEADLLDYGVEQLANIDGLRFVGTAPDRAAILSFVVDGCHPQDVGTLLDRHGVAVRTGHHCAQPALKALGLTSTVRASLAAYSNRADLDRLADALDRSLAMLR